jgi:hypothetical protein
VFGFNNELMTGFIDQGANPLSRVTIASFGDLGYQVDLSAADPYTLPLSPALGSGRAPSAERPDPARGIDLGDDVLRMPLRVVDAAGNITRIIDPDR